MKTKSIQYLKQLELVLKTVETKQTFKLIISLYGALKRLWVRHGALIGGITNVENMNVDVV